MLHIQLTLSDVARIRLASTADPRWEIRHSLRIIRNNIGDPVFGPWRRRAATMAPSFRHQPSLPTTCGQGAKVPPPQDSAGGGYFDSALAPQWKHIRSHVEIEVCRLQRRLASEGLERTLTHVSPLIQWKSPILQISRNGPHRDLQLGGRGLILQPSFFAYDHVSIARDGSGALILIYPIQHSGPACPENATRSTHFPLSSLIGHTRAQALATLQVNPCTTTQLAAHLRVSLASASEQAKVLRDAGLLNSFRHGRAVTHRASALGVRLLEEASEPLLHRLRSA